MEEALISKKDLLELTNISYGQLYRWKRKGLIPEEWFIKKSSFTGQETFFPKNKVLSRVEKIVSMKEDISLDDLADVFSPLPDDISLGAEELIKRNIVSEEVLRYYLESSGGDRRLGFYEILQATIANKFIVSGDIGLEEAKSLLEVLREGIIKFGASPFEVFLTRKLGVFMCFASCPPCELCVDGGLRLLGKVGTASAVEELKSKLA